MFADLMTGHHFSMLAFKVDGDADIVTARLNFKFSPEPDRYAPLK